MRSALITLLVAVTPAFANPVVINRVELGSGTPGAAGIENAAPWGNDMYHAPQYMPGYPTAATIYPRVVYPKCKQDGEIIHCDGYNWTPDKGRGEYLLIQPEIMHQPEPPVPIAPPVIINPPPIAGTDPNPVAAVYVEGAIPEIVYVPVDRFVYRSEPVESPKIVPARPKRRVIPKSCNK